MHGLLLKCSGLFSFSLLSCLIAFHGIASAPTPAPQAKQEVKHHSLKAIRARIAELRAKQKEEEKEGKEKRRGEEEEEEGGEGLGYWEALEAYVAVRAYPNDFIDWDALKSGVDHREQMAGRSFLSGNWEFLGPRNCASPSQWAFGPGRISGRIASAAFHPSNPLVIYIASSGGGVWRTSDGGVTWQPLSDGWSTMNTSCVTLDPSNPTTVFAGTGDYDGWGGYSHGIMRSIDGGTTWTEVGRAQFGNNAVRRILVDPENGQIVTAVTGRGSQGSGKVWRSTDGGTTWNVIVNANSYWSDIVCSAKDGGGNRTYYAVGGGTGAQMWKSTDRGASWSQLTTPMRSGASQYDTADIAVSPTTPGTVYLLGTGNRKLWKSVNNGSTWTDITGAQLTSASWGQSWYDFYVSCSTNGSTDVLYVGLIDILQSWDGGTTWRSFMNGYSGNDKAHVDEHDIVVDPTNANHLLSCSDGGVYNVLVSPTTGIGTFSSLNAALALTEFYYGDFHPTDGDRMLGGAQDNGSPGSLGPNNWRSVTGGDGGVTLINQTNPNIQYTTYQYFGGSSSGSNNDVGFNRTTNNWGSSSWVHTIVSPDRVAWMGPAVMAANNSSVLYVGTNYLWKYTDTTNTWTPRLGNTQLSSGSTIACIGVTLADPNVIYTGSGDGQLFVTRTAGTAWTQINTGAVSLPNRAYTAVRASDNNANDLLVGLSGSGTPHLWRCFDTSAGTRTWVNVSGTGPTGLPDSPINAVERDPSDPAATWYVGTDIGVFRTVNAGSSWENITQPLGLPNVQISTLKVRNNYLCAATYGRGMWRLSLSGSGGGGGVTLSSLTLNPTAVIGPAPSTGTVTLSGPAPTGGVTVALTSNNAVATVPGNVTIPEGNVSANFTITTTVVTSQTIANIKGTLNAATVEADLTVNTTGLTNISVAPLSVIGGNTAQGSVSIATPAPVGGSLIQLNSSNTAVAQVPASVTIPQGQTTVGFTVTTTPTGNDAVSTIKATLGATTVQTQLTVSAPDVQLLTLGVPTVVGGNPVTGTITLNGKAPSGGAVISLSSSETTVATVLPTVTVPAGATSVTFIVTTKIVTLDSGVVITATYRGSQRIADLQVTAQKLLSVTLTPNPAVGGNIVQGRVNLAGPAIGPTVVQLASSNTSFATVPASVTIPSGQGGVNFSVTTKTVLTNSSVEIFATFGGSAKQGLLTLLPLQLTSLTLSTYSTFERQTVIGTVALNGPALVGGAVVQIANSNPAAATMPTSVIIPQGQSSKTFTITAQSVTSVQTTQITASRNGVSLQKTLSVTPISLQSIQLSASTITGGISTSGVVRIVAPAPAGGYVVTLTSSYPSVAKVPLSVTIPAGATSAPFAVTTVPVNQTYFVTITGSKGLSTVSTQLQVLPPEVSAFTLSPTSIKGGSNITGTVTLTGKAPAGGMTVNISSNPNVAHPAGSVVVPAGATSVRFTINTSSVSAPIPLQMSARTLSVTKFALLTLTP